MVALADEDTPVEYRRRFYRNNPMPGARWIGAPNEPILQNPADFMPEGYNQNDLSDDIDATRDKMNLLNRKAPKYFCSMPSFEPEGSKAMLTCNTQENLRIIYLPVLGNLNDYYAGLRFEGDITEYANLKRLTPREQLLGCLCLLGEVPVTAALEFPTYVTRNRAGCTEMTNLQYRNTLRLKYT